MDKLRPLKSSWDSNTNASKSILTLNEKIFSEVASYNPNPSITNLTPVTALETELRDEDLIVENKSPSKEMLLTSEDPAMNIVFPLITETKPPSGIPLEYVETMWCSSTWYKELRSWFILSKRPRVQRELIRGYLGLYMERCRHLSTFPFIIYPFSDFCWWWNIFIMVMLFGTLIYEPLRFTFWGDQYVGDKDLAVSWTTSSILLFDMVLQFWTGTLDKSSLVVVLEPTMITTRYLSSWFFFDLLTRIPMDSIAACTINDINDPQELILVRILGLVKILRFTTFLRLLGDFLKSYYLKKLTIRLIKLVFMILFVIHWFACLHWLLPDLVNTRLQQPKPGNWITRYSLRQKPKETQYLNMLLRSISNLLLVGYGENIPTAVEEILCTQLCTLTGITLFAMLIATIIAIFQTTHLAEHRYLEILEVIDEYMRFRKIPSSLQDRVYAYYQHKYCGHYFPEELILGTLSQNLRSEIRIFNCRHLVEKVPMFRNVPANIIVDIVERLEYEVYVPGDVVVTCGRTGDCMYFVEIGILEVLTSTGNHIGEIRDGNFFGEIALVTDNDRMANVIAKSYCEIYRLSREDFRKCIQSYPEVYQSILNSVNERVGFECKAAAFDRRVQGEKESEGYLNFLPLTEQN